MLELLSYLLSLFTMAISKTSIIKDYSKVLDVHCINLFESYASNYSSNMAQILISDSNLQ